MLCSLLPSALPLGLFFLIFFEVFFGEDGVAMMAVGAGRWQVFCKFTKYKCIGFGLDVQKKVQNKEKKKNYKKKYGVLVLDGLSSRVLRLCVCVCVCVYVCV